MQDRAFFPREVTSDIPRITMVGSERVQVEQHKGLAVYQPGLILFRASGSRIRITGKELRFRSYSAHEAVVEGDVDSVSVEQAMKGGVPG